MTDKQAQYIKNAPLMSDLNQEEDKSFIDALKKLIENQEVELSE
jgi:hypothetical protein